MTRVLALALLAAFALVGCSSSHLRVFGTGEEAQFSAWVETYRGLSSFEAADQIASWMSENMQYEPGSSSFWPGYIDAWNQRTNCAGYARVAIEALHRLGFEDFRIVVAYNNYADRWHVICTNGICYTSNGAFGVFPTPQSSSELATFAQNDWVVWQIRDRNMTVIEEGSR